MKEKHAVGCVQLVMLMNLWKMNLLVLIVGKEGKIKSHLMEGNDNLGTILINRKVE